MNIYEVWDKLDKLNESEVDPIDKILWSLPDCVLHFDGFERDYVSDHYDPESRYGHYQTSQKYYWDDFEYEIDTVTMFELLFDKVIKENIDKVPNTEIISKLKTLYKAMEDAPKEEEEQASFTLGLFIAENLETLVELFEEVLKEYYVADAEDWAEEHLDPENLYGRY